MHFGEYELSPSLIGLSPPPSAHPEAFQRLLVRPSTWCYPSFSLAKGRSLGFASAPPDSTPSSDSLSLRIQDSCPLTLPGKATRRFIMQKARRHCNNAAPTACRHMVSGTISLPCSGCFSPFPHGTGSLSVSREYLALPDGPGGPALLRIPLRFGRLSIRSFHALWLFFPEHSAHRCSCDGVVLQPHTCRNKDGLGSSPVARHYWGNHSYFLFLQVLRCFSSLRWPPALSRMSSLQDDGLSHSDIRGSKAICAYPRLFAAYHVLLRLREPRHPPCALSYFPSHALLQSNRRKRRLFSSRHHAADISVRSAVRVCRFLPTCHRTMSRKARSGE